MESVDLSANGSGSYPDGSERSTSTDPDASALLEASLLATPVNPISALATLHSSVEAVAHGVGLDEDLDPPLYRNPAGLLLPLKIRRRKRPASPHDADKEVVNRYNCEVCGYSTNHNWILKRHHLTHSGEKPFPCEICGKSFRQKAHLSGHRRIHTGEKCFVCQVCNESFKRSDALKKHRQSHDANGLMGSPTMVSESLTGIAATMAAVLGETRTAPASVPVQSSSH